ncbi:hypothetical protein FJZ31_01245 [Candidatus Poribacteria bacterium]|nr:hypothetical protein [Candidatus Poribacteria bacterium]
MNIVTQVANREFLNGQNGKTARRPGDKELLAILPSCHLAVLPSYHLAVLPSCPLTITLYLHLLKLALRWYNRRNRLIVAT